MTYFRIFLDRRISDFDEFYVEAKDSRIDCGVVQFILNDGTMTTFPLTSVVFIQEITKEDYDRAFLDENN